MIKRSGIFLLAMLLSATTQVAAAPHTLTKLSLIPLVPGLNRVLNFATDGRSATIVQGWRDNGNAHGYNLFLVLMETEKGKADWNVVGVEPGDPQELFEDTIRDAPHTGEDYITSVRFAHGLVDGKKETLLLMAVRQIDSQPSIPDPSFTRFYVYKLVRMDGGPGTVDQFQLIETRLSATKFCNSELALARKFSTPLTSNMEGMDPKTGCF